MIELLRALEPRQMRQLIRVLDPRADLDDVDDEGVLDELVATLRRALEVPDKDDLPEFIRRRLVDVAVKQFELVDNADSMTDTELARTLADFLIEVSEGEEGRKEFEVFLRTKSRRERLEWLVASQRARALAADKAFDKADAQRHAEEIQGEQTAAHEATAAAILDDLGSLAKRDRSGARKAAAAAATAGSSAGMLGAVGAAGAASVAMPLAALAGGLFMAGRSKRGLARSAAGQADKQRANRARRSRLVQSTVALSVFAAAVDASE